MFRFFKNLTGDKKAPNQSVKIEIMKLKDIVN